ncbi:fatty acid desaturase family protein, partial [Telluribacter humicola]
WVLLKDFIQYQGFIKSGVNRKSIHENRRMLLGLILMKSVYLLAFFGVPIFLFQLPWLEVVAGFLLMHFTAGTVLTVIFQLAHTVEGTSHPIANEQGIIEKDWAIHQLETTVNFSPRNKWLSWYIGGLNFQIEHHLFPKICHVHYPKIAPIVKKTALEFGLEYQENATFMQALRSHIITLRRFGSLNDLNEAIG